LNIASEDEFERQLLAKGVISHIPTRDETDEEFDKFEPIEFGGEPLSETIVRERRQTNAAHTCPECPGAN